MYQDLDLGLINSQVFIERNLSLLLEWEIGIWPKVNSVLSKTDCVSDFYINK